MKKIQALLIAAMLTTAGTAFADHDGMGEHCKMHTKVTFEQADKDKDGTLDREEAKAVCGEKFDVMDTDKDGTLTKEELNACGRKKHNEHDKLHQKRSKEFAAADKDADGTLTKEELMMEDCVLERWSVMAFWHMECHISWMNPFW